MCAEGDADGWFNDHRRIGASTVAAPSVATSDGDHAGGGSVHPKPYTAHSVIGRYPMPW